VSLSFSLHIFFYFCLEQLGAEKNNQNILVITSGASSLEKRGLSLKGSFWYHFSARDHIFSWDYKPTDEFCDVANVSYRRNSADTQYMGNICSL